MKNRMKGICKVPQCDKKNKKNNTMCSMHSARWQRHGTTDSRSQMRVNGNQVTLTRGQVAIIDTEDAERVSRHTWHAAAHGYAATRLRDKNGELMYLHRYVLNAPNGKYVDHVNLDKLDNRKANLRLCTNSQNHANKPKRKGETLSRYKGVTLAKNGRVWQMQLQWNGQRFVKRFKSENDAARYYNEKALELWGSFALPNEIQETDRVIQSPIREGQEDAATG
jgi:uncharacterized protein (DUF1330 family)